MSAHIDTARAISAFKKGQTVHTGRVRRGVSKDRKSQAEFANAAYTAPTNRPTVLHGMKYDAEESDERVAVYHNQDHVEVSYRGSVDKSDWLVSDVGIATGFQMYTPLFMKDMKQWKHLHNVFDDDQYQYYLAGHSLGGTRAYEIARTTADVGASTFNLGANASLRNRADKRAFISGDPRFTNIYNYHTAHDKVSMLSNYMGGHNVLIKGYDRLGPKGAHDLDNFLE